MLIFSLPSLIIALLGSEATQLAIWLGAGGGALVGAIGGGVAGAWGSLQRAKLNRMYQEACELAPSRVDVHGGQEGLGGT